MPAKIIAIENTKGGTGKSTITTNLACHLMLEGFRVLIVDRDPLRISSKWRKVSTCDKHPIVVEIQTPTIHRDIKQVVNNFDYILIDGAAVVEAMAISAIRAADFVLIPIRPSVPETWGSEPVFDIVKARQELSGGKPLCRILINGNKRRTKLSQRIHKIIQPYGLSILNSRISESIIYPECFEKGLSVVDLKDAVSAPLRKEFKDLADEIKELLI